MANIDSEVSKLLKLETIINSTKGKVAPFAYDDTGYANETKEGIEGVELYDYEAHQNIPIGDAPNLDTNNTTLAKGIRAQGSSLSRAVINHFFGRTSFNLNKIHEWFSRFLQIFQSHLKQDGNLWVPTITYTKGDVVFVLDTIELITGYEIPSPTPPVDPEPEPTPPEETNPPAEADATEGDGEATEPTEPTEPVEPTPTPTPDPVPITEERHVVRFFRCIEDEGTGLLNIPPINETTHEVDILHWQENNIYDNLYVNHFHGLLEAASIPDNSITTEKLADASVTTEKIAEEAVTTEKIAEEAVTETKIADAAVTETKIADHSVTKDKLADGLSGVFKHIAEIEAEGTFVPFSDFSDFKYNPENEYSAFAVPDFAAPNAVVSPGRIEEQNGEMGVYVVPRFLPSSEQLAKMVKAASGNATFGSFVFGQTVFNGTVKPASVVMTIIVC